MDIASLETSVELGAIRSSDETIGATNSKIKKKKKKKKKGFEQARPVLPPSPLPSTRILYYRS